MGNNNQFRDLQMLLRSSMGQVGGGGSSDGLRRPMTSMRGTGYTSQNNVFDPLNQASKGPAPPLISKTEER